MKYVLSFVGGALIGGYGMLNVVCYCLEWCTKDGTVVQENESVKIIQLKNKKGECLPLLYAERKKKPNKDEEL